MRVKHENTKPQNHKNTKRKESRKTTQSNSNGGDEQKVAINTKKRVNNLATRGENTENT